MKATMAWRCRACDDFGERLLAWKGHQSLVQLDDSLSIYQLSDVVGKTSEYLTDPALLSETRVVDSLAIGSSNDDTT
ncbi:hypothetical protein Tco_0621641 [Tanacetum coccineum]